MYLSHRLAAVALPCALAAVLAGVVLAAGAAPVVKAGSTGLGKVLVDSRGHTLYLFEHDKGTKSACYGKCATFWPPLLTSAKATPGSGVKAALLGTTRRTDGTLQVTYHGHPLYLFLQDTKAGQTTGENVDAFGGEWYAVSPAGLKVEKKAAQAAPGTTTGSGGGGGYGNYGG